MKLYSYKTILKEVPPNLIEGIKKNATDQDHEYNIEIDFDRELEQPDRLYMMKGGKDRTTKLGNFDLFGHNHPNHYYPPSLQIDLANLEFFKQNFIVAGLSVW